jgi:hypothetical protein
MVAARRRAAHLGRARAPPAIERDLVRDDPWLSILDRDRVTTHAMPLGVVSKNVASHPSGAPTWRHTA